MRCDVPFVGRDHERALLDAALQLVRDGRSGIISIVGEAGAGKTRLADEIVEGLEDEAIVIRTACAPYGETNSLAPVVDGLAALLALDPDATARRHRGGGALTLVRAVGPRRRRRRRAPLPRHGDVPPRAHASPLDRLDPATARDAVAGTLTDMLRRDAQTRMTVLWVDNLQWAEPRLRDQLGVLVRTLSELPFLLITCQRPDPDVVWPPVVERPVVLQVPLGPLRAEEASTLVRGVLERGDADTGDAGGRRARHPWRRQPAVPGRARRAGGDVRFGVRAAGLAAGVDRGPPRPAPARRSGRSSTTLPCSATATPSGHSSASPRSSVRSSGAATSTSWPPTAWSTSRVTGGASAAPSSVRSPTRR